MRSTGGVRKKLLFSLLGAGAALAIAAPAASAGLTWIPTYHHSFGLQPVGSAAPAKTFTLRATCNQGSAPSYTCFDPAPNGTHSFGAPSVTGDGYSIGLPNTCSTGALATPMFDLVGVTCVTTVNFTAASAGPKDGMLVLPNGPDVTLFGNGEAPAKGKKGKKCKGKSAASAKKKKKKCGKKRK